MTEAEPILVPFLKWAGGKRWLAVNYTHLFPDKFDCYVEPFLGSAAIFFHLRPQSAILSDQNAELINVYAELRDNGLKVESALRRHSRLHSDTYYYGERGRRRRAPHERAAQFLYLNRTCWNGLYRVNLQGTFNVPIGTKDAVLLDTDDFKGTASLLQRAQLKVSDFEPVLDAANRGDFVFVDPPYVTRHNFNGFVKYNDKIFSWADQERLATAVCRAAKRGVKILVTNADHPSIRQLYKGVEARASFQKLLRHSVLAADSSNRGAITEIGITINYGA